MNIDVDWVIQFYLTYLCVEILAVMIRDVDIKGIYINEVGNKISQLTDDTQLMDNGDEVSFENS